jgi:hypothetical protein
MKIIASFIIVVLSMNCFAQKAFFSQTAEFIIPETSLRSTHRDGFGTSFQFEMLVTKKFSVTTAIGLMTFGKKTLSPNTPPIYTIALKTVMIPIQAGARFYPWTNTDNPSGPYLSAETGVHVLTGKAFVNGLENKMDSSTGFSYSVGAGYRKGRLDFGAKHQSIRNGGASIYYTALKMAWQLSRQK